MDVLQHDLDKIYAAKKYITCDHIRWRFHEGRFNLEVPVVIESGEPLRLVGNYSPGSRRDVGYSFSLLYRTSIIIRRWDCAAHHFGRPCSHKHKADKEVYEVDDISLTDVNEAFTNFLDECTIDFSGSYERVIVKSFS